MTSLFEVQHLMKAFGGQQVVNDLSFSIAPGECLGVIGPNGAGKTTTIRMCLGLTRPDSGQITALGLRMPQDNLAIKAKLGVVSQMDTLDPDFSCYENLLVYGRYFGLKDKEIHARIPSLLEFASLSNKAKSKPGELSGGMKRRLSLARALVNDPQLLLLDEPTTGLDPQGIIEVRDLILRLKNEQNKTVILSSHQLAEIELVANRMVIINKGQTIIEGSVAELMNAQETLLHIELAQNSQGAATLIHEILPAVKIQVSSPKTLELNVEKQHIALLNSKLV